ncbi:chemotaxis protein CheW [Sphingosinicella terrae]|uniref:chemotaxis protein CheW n=1 Tax=Sphingosinicella terrae TaxID=2172047 RepID=UPI000E0E05F7|nr:chemotaxis protein CheW [Sphingosinicella terrae]
MIRAGDLPVSAEFLDEAAIATLLARRQAAYGDARDLAVLGGSDLLLWNLGAERYALPLADIKAVAALPRVTRVPGAPAALAGLVSRRGVVHNLFDPAAVLGADPLADDGAARMIVLRHERPCIALRVSGVAATAAFADDGDADAGLARLVETPEGERFTLVSTPRLIERLLARPSPKEG